MPGCAVDELFRSLTLSLLATFAGVLFPFLLLALAIPYAVLKLRRQRDEENDPQVGLKAALHYFFSVSVILFLSGFNILAVEWVREKKPPPAPVVGRQPKRPLAASITGENPTQRLGTALTFSGLTFGLAHLALIVLATNDRRWPAARRLFTGWRLAIHGLVILFVFTGLMITLFVEDLEMETLKSYLATLAVWMPAWAVDFTLLRLHSRQPPGHRAPPFAMAPVDAESA